VIHAIHAYGAAVWEAILLRPHAAYVCAAVSTAFSCLTDPQKRAFYDRTGHEDQNAASAANFSRGRGAGAYPGEIDPEELFNMMFGGMRGGGFGMGPMHFGGFRNAPRQQGQQNQQEEGNAPRGHPFAGPLPPGISNILGMISRSSPMHKMMLLMMLYNMLPLLLFFLSWMWWVLGIGVPLWLISHEVAAFEERSLYRPLQQLRPVRDAVRSVMPHASAFLRLTHPVVVLVMSLGQVFLEWARSMASV
jgi:hypothetical protein